MQPLRDGNWSTKAQNRDLNVAPTSSHSLPVRGHSFAALAKNGLISLLDFSLEGSVCACCHHCSSQCSHKIVSSMQAQMASCKPCMNVIWSSFTPCTRGKLAGGHQQKEQCLRSQYWNAISTYIWEKNVRWMTNYVTIWILAQTEVSVIQLSSALKYLHKYLYLEVAILSW